MSKSTFKSGLTISTIVIALTAGTITTGFGQVNNAGGDGSPAPKPPVTVIEVPPAAPIVQRVAPAAPNTSVVIPIVVTSEIPVVTKEPVKVSEVVRNLNVVQSLTVFDKKPVEPVRDLTVGGIPAAKKDDLPFTTVNGASTRRVEVQVLQDVPTSVIVDRLAPRATAQVTITGPNGKPINLGRFRVSANGDLELPPLTLERKGLAVKLQITVGGKTRTITIRATN